PRGPRRGNPRRTQRPRDPRRRRDGSRRASWARAHDFGGRQAFRTEAVLELVAEQIDWRHNLFEMNPAGRVQTKKFRSIKRISATWAPWLKSVTSGPIVTYRGGAVKSIKTAMRNLVSKAELPGRVNSTSIRHTLGR